MAMGNVAAQPLTSDAFYAWVSGREDRYELVHGRPQMMGGTKKRNSTITGNINEHIRPQLRRAGKGCKSFESDIYVRIPSSGNCLLPDLVVDCDPAADEDTMEAEKPTLVVEVLSKSTKYTDFFIKLGEYKSLESTVYILYIEPDSRLLIFYYRDPIAGWGETTFDTLDAVILMPALGLSLPMSVVYRDTAISDLASNIK